MPTTVKTLARPRYVLPHFPDNQTYHQNVEGSERIIQVHGCDDCTGLGHESNLVSVVVVARPRTGVSKDSIESVRNRYQTINV